MSEQPQHRSGAEEIRAMRDNEWTKHEPPQEQIDLIVGALDSLGVALANHGHEWTDGERAIYEEAIKTLSNMAEEWRRLRQ